MLARHLGRHESTFGISMCNPCSSAACNSVFLTDQGSNWVISRIFWMFFPRVERMSLAAILANTATSGHGDLRRDWKNPTLFRRILCSKVCTPVVKTSCTRKECVALGTFHEILIPVLHARKTIWASGLVKSQSSDPCILVQYFSIANTFSYVSYFIPFFWITLQTIWWYS